MIKKLKYLISFVKQFKAPQHYSVNSGFAHAFLEKNNHIVLNDVCYHSINELKFLLIHILDSFYVEKKIQSSYIKKEKRDVYLVEFLYNKIDGVMDYTPEVYRVKNDAIELELLLDYIADNKLAYGIIGANYHIAKSLLPDIYHVVEELDIASERIET